MQRICGNCGADVRIEQMQFCGYCGYKLAPIETADTLIDALRLLRDHCHMRGDEVAQKVWDARIEVVANLVADSASATLAVPPAAVPSMYPYDLDIVDPMMGVVEDGGYEAQPRDDHDIDEVSDRMVPEADAVDNDEETKRAMPEPYTLHCDYCGHTAQTPKISTAGWPKINKQVAGRDISGVCPSCYAKKVEGTLK